MIELKDWHVILNTPTVNMSKAYTNFVDNDELVQMVGIPQGVIGMVLNTLAWLVILRTKGLHNMTNYLLAYLAVVDSLACFSVFLRHVTAGYAASFEWDIYCRIVDSSFLQAITAKSSSFGLCLVTYVRYIGIVHPLHYPRLVSVKKVTTTVFLTWILSFLITSPHLFYKASPTGQDRQIACDLTQDSIVLNAGVIMTVVFGYLFPILFMSWAYHNIQVTLKRGAQQLRQQNVQGAALELLQARQNVINILRLVIGALFVLWTPLVAWVSFCSIQSIEKLCFSNTGETTLSILSCIYSMNSVINPIIYVFKYKKFRNGLQDMLCCCTGQYLRPNQVGVQIAMNEP